MHRAHGIPEVPSKFPFGNAESAAVFTGTLAFIRMCDGIYEQYKQLPVVGYFSLNKPFLMVNDLELAKLIMIKDFDHFVDRRKIDVNENVDINRYMANMLTSMEGDKWKNMRSTLSPIFTSGKLKAMTQMISKVRGHLQDVDPSL
jgi:cytochrome P450